MRLSPYFLTHPNLTSFHVPEDDSTRCQVILDIQNLFCCGLASSISHFHLVNSLVILLSFEFALKVSKHQGSKAFVLSSRTNLVVLNKLAISIYL